MRLLEQIEKDLKELLTDKAFQVYIQLITTRTEPMTEDFLKEAKEQAYMAAIVFEEGE